MSRTTTTSSRPKAAPAPRRERACHSAQDKCRAVLAIWAERRKPAEVCKELGISWIQLSQWQNQAMLGMLGALEPRMRPEEERGPALSPKLQRLLEKQANQRLGKVARRLEARLARIQQEQGQPTPTNS